MKLPILFLFFSLLPFILLGYPSFLFLYFSLRKRPFSPAWKNIFLCRKKISLSYIDHSRVRVYI